MANNIQLVEKMLPLVDEVYRIEAKSSVLDVPNVLTQDTGDAKTIQEQKFQKYLKQLTEDGVRRMVLSMQIRRYHKIG